MYPNFLCIGAQRCGTTWLFENLRQHPDIFMPSKKEINFFSTINADNYQKGLSWYADFFSKADSESAIGEITPEYLADPCACDRIRNSLGRIKLIAILRNPLHRAFSSFGKGLREGNWDIPFETFLETNTDFCIDRGLYHASLVPYIETFGRDNVLIQIYEDIQKDAYQFLKKIYKFLEVDTQFVSGQAENRFNIGVSRRGRTLSGITALRDSIYASPFGRSIKWVQRNAFVNRIMTRMMTSGKQDLVIPDGMKNNFYEDTVSLSELLDRNLVEEWDLEP